MTQDERLDEIIRNAASDYNRAPAVPRDDMWNAIVAQKNAVPRLHVSTGGAGAGRSSRRFPASYAWIGMAAAAALLVATGVGIGRWTNRTSQPVASENPVRVIAENPAPVPGDTNDEIGAPAPAHGDEATPPRPRSREEIRRNPVVVGNGGIRPLGGTRMASAYPADSRTTNAVYQVATSQHLANAEALLTSFSLGSRDAKMDAQFADWAKGLLSNTRLLLDSPAGDDPRRAKLLMDLEQVLAQIAQLSPTAAAQDRELIQGSIQEGHVMTRLRTAIPAASPRDILER